MTIANEAVVNSNLVGYSTSVPALLVDTSIALITRHKLAIRAWTDSRIIIFPDKQRFLLRWLQQSIVRSAPGVSWDDSESWSTLRYFLQSMPEDRSRLAVHRKLCNPIMKALNSDSDTLNEACLAVLYLLADNVTSFPHSQLRLLAKRVAVMRPLLDNHLHLLQVLVRTAYNQTRTESEQKTLLKYFKDLPVGFDRHHLQILIETALDPNAVLALWLIHRPQLIEMYCETIGKPELVGTAITLASTRMKQSVEWWIMLMDSMGSESKKHVRRSDLDRLLVAHGSSLDERIVAMDPSLYHSLPLEQRGDGTQATFIKQSSLWEVAQLPEVVPCGPLSTAAVRAKCAQADKLEIARVLGSLVDRQALTELIVSNADLRNIAFVKGPFKQNMLNALSKYSSELITNVCLMLSENGEEESREQSCEDVGMLAEYNRAHVTVNGLFQCEAERHLRNKAIDHFVGLLVAKQDSSIPSLVDLFQSDEDLVYLGKKLLERSSGELAKGLLENVLDQLSLCMLPWEDAHFLLIKAGQREDIQTKGGTIHRLAKSVIHSSEAVYPEQEMI